MMKMNDLLFLFAIVNTDSASAGFAAVQPLRQLPLQLQQLQVALWVPLADVEDDLKPFQQLLQSLLSARLDSLAQIVLTQQT